MFVKNIFSLFFTTFGLSFFANATNYVYKSNYVFYKPPVNYSELIDDISSDNGNGIIIEDSGSDSPPIDDNDSNLGDIIITQPVMDEHTLLLIQPQLADTTPIDYSSYGHTPSDFNISFDPDMTLFEGYKPLSAYFSESITYTNPEFLDVIAKGDYTFEGWLLIPERKTGINNYLYQVGNSTGWINRIHMSRNEDNQGKIHASSDNNKIKEEVYPSNAWFHYAFVRSGDLKQLYINGSLYGEFSSPAINLSNFHDLHVLNKSKGNALGVFEGLLQNFRISKIARYTENFVPVAEPF